MTTATATTLTYADAWREVTARNISVVPAFDGKFWCASVTEKGTSVATLKRDVRMISATSSTPIGAVKSLIALLDSQAQERALFESEAIPF